MRIKLIVVFVFLVALLTRFSYAEDRYFDSYYNQFYSGAYTKASEVDFLAYQRGVEAAREANQREYLRQRQRSQWMQEERQGNIERIVDGYLSTTIKNRQNAINMGMVPREFWPDYKKQIMQDSYFQKMPIEAQVGVINKLNELQYLFDGIR